MLRLDKTLWGMVRDWICEVQLVCVRLGKNRVLNIALDGVEHCEPNN